MATNAQAPDYEFDGIHFIHLSSSPLARKIPHQAEPEYTGILDTEKEWETVTNALDKAGAKLKCKHAPLNMDSIIQAVRAGPKILMILTHGTPTGDLVSEQTGKDAHLASKLLNDDLRKAFEQIKKEEVEYMKKQADKQKVVADFDDESESMSFGVGDEPPADRDDGDELSDDESMFSISMSGSEPSTQSKPQVKQAKAKPPQPSNLKLVCLVTCHAGIAAELFTETLRVPHVVGVGGAELAAQCLTAVFYGEFFDRLVGKTVRQAYEMGMKKLMRETPEKYGQDEMFCKAEAVKYNLVGHGDHKETRLQLSNLHNEFKNMTPVVPHNKLLAFMEYPDWNRKYWVRNRMVHLLLTDLAAGDCDTVVLFGAPGMGKSTVARRLAHYVWSRRTWFTGGVFYINRRDVETKGPKGEEKQLLVYQVARMLHYVNKDAGGREMDPRWDPMKMITETVGQWATEKDPVLMVLDNMDSHWVDDKQLEDLMQALVGIGGKKSRPVRILVTCRKAKEFAGKGRLRELEKIPDDREIYKRMCRRWPGEKSQKLGPWDWRWAKDKAKPEQEKGVKDVPWIMDTLIQGNPGMAREVHHFAVKQGIRDPEKLQDAWESHKDYGKLGKGGGLTREQAIGLFGQGYTSSEDHTPRLPTSGWHHWAAGDEHDEHDSVDDSESDSRRRRRHRHRHRHRRARGSRRLRELRAEHERLLAENRELTGRVRQVQAVVRRALRLL